MNVFLDIETLPTSRADVREHIEESLRDELQQDLDAVCAPSNYKDPDKIAEYIAGKRASLKTEFDAKLEAKVSATGLDGSFGQICVIGWAGEKTLAVSLHNVTNELDLLSGFAIAMDLMVPASRRFDSTIIGHNVAWDLRFLIQRYIVNGIKPPMVIARAAQAKPWEAEKVYDTMIQWAGVGSKISLDKLCLALSIPSPKGELDGSKVAEWVAAGKIAEVAEYCCGDVRAVREVWRRMTFQTVEQLEDVPA